MCIYVTHLFIFVILLVDSGTCNLGSSKASSEAALAAVVSFQSISSSDYIDSYVHMVLIRTYNAMYIHYVHII